MNVHELHLKLIGNKNIIVYDSCMIEIACCSFAVFSLCEIISFYVYSNIISPLL